ncbi:MAG: hypothetical protein MHM6MM_002790 [Cercozoa sp. M6MM]
MPYATLSVNSASEFVFTGFPEAVLDQLRTEFVDFAPKPDVRSIEDERNQLIVINRDQLNDDRLLVATLNVLEDQGFELPTTHVRTESTDLGTKSTTVFLFHAKSQ